MFLVVLLWWLYIFFPCYCDLWLAWWGCWWVKGVVVVVVVLQVLYNVTVAVIHMHSAGV